MPGRLGQQILELEMHITEFFNTKKKNALNCTLDMISTFLAQQTNPKLFLAFWSGIHKVLPKTLGDLLKKIYLCAF